MDDMRIAFVFADEHAIVVALCDALDERSIPDSIR